MRMVKIIYSGSKEALYPNLVGTELPTDKVMLFNTSFASNFTSIKPRADNKKTIIVTDTQLAILVPETDMPPGGISVYKENVTIFLNQTYPGIVGYMSEHGITISFEVVTV